MTIRLTRREFVIAGGAAMLALPAAAGWLVLSLVLGRVQERRATLIDREEAKGQNGTPSDANLAAETTGAADFGAADDGGPMTGERA